MYRWLVELNGVFVTYAYTSKAASEWLGMSAGYTVTPEYVSL